MRGEKPNARLGFGVTIYYSVAPDAALCRTPARWLGFLIGLY